MIGWKCCSGGIQVFWIDNSPSVKVFKYTLVKSHQVYPIGLLSTWHLFQENLPLLSWSQYDNKFKETIKGIDSCNLSFINSLGNIKVAEKITTCPIQPLKSIKFVVALHPLGFKLMCTFIFWCLYVQPREVKSIEGSELTWYRGNIAFNFSNKNLNFLAFVNLDHSFMW